MVKKQNMQMMKSGKDAPSMEAEKIIDELVEAQPRLKAARDALRDADQTEDNIVLDTLKTFRQRLKE